MNWSIPKDLGDSKILEEILKLRILKRILEGLCWSLLLFVRLQSSKMIFTTGSLAWKQALAQVHTHRRTQPHPLCHFESPTYTQNGILSTNISLLQSWWVIDTISSDSNNGTLALTSLDNDKFLLWWCSGKNNLSVFLQYFIKLFPGNILQKSYTIRKDGWAKTKIIK